jgi:peptidoglycan hydrolase-like protein with peptidoglycan-binding domain
VTELQRRLARGGYYDGAIDGIMGPATRRAIRAYERDRGYSGR